MIINHINLTVTDVGAAATFLETYFGLQDQGGDEKMGFLFDDNGMVVTLMKGGANIKYPGAFHIGFMQESEAQVNAIHQRLKDDGFDVKAPQQLHGWTFYVQAPGGFTVEVMA